jgi:ABC-type spermidine/putrescine transport system permease subunit II
MVLGVAPFMLPPVITALGFLSFWATIGFYGQPWTAVISHAIFFVTLPLVALSLGFASIDRSLVEAAATMGADDRTVFRTVVLPLIRPYVISGYAFAFVLSLNEYIIAYMTIGFTMETLPIKISDRTAADGCHAGGRCRQSRLHRAGSGRSREPGRRSADRAGIGDGWVRRRGHSR